jgi:uncharacterized protein YbaP (TraB family)
MLRRSWTLAMMKFVHKYLALWLLCLACPGLYAQEQLDCRPYKIIEYELTGPERFKQGMLWEVSRAGDESAYVFGTIHVDDEDILKLPDIVVASLDNSRHFVMETVPSAEDTAIFSASMFFMDGNRLDRILPEALFHKTVAILEGYSLDRQIVTVMKPWAAYIIMSYPADMGMVLDVKLMEHARKNGARISGLESLDEQIDVFSDMNIQDQARVLADAVCHYDTVGTDIDIMKSLYIKRDLEGLYVYGQRYSFEDNTVYEHIYGRLISDRNRLMVERIDGILHDGPAFIAVGAMHLPGEDGVLNLLEQSGYKVTLIY